MAKEIKTIRDKLQKAFANHSRPVDSEIAFDAPTDPNYEGTLAARAFEKLDDWRDFTPDILVSAEGYLDTALISFLQPEGFVYFLPGFLWHAIDLDASEHNETLLDAVVFQLTAPDNWDLSALDNPDVKVQLEQAGTSTKKEDFINDQSRQRFMERVTKLSDAQAQAVAYALNFAANEFDRRYSDDTPRVALRSYWQQYLPDDT